MQSGNAVIIHISPIIQQGLKNILLAGNIGINEIMNAFPECSVLSEWKKILLFVDTQYVEEYKKNGKILKKNGNTVFGIETIKSTNQSDLSFDEILNINDKAEIILQKISDHGTRISDHKSNNQLSAREIEILTKIAQGLSNKLIADQLFLSIHTVITHRKNITFKLGIKSISGLTLYAALNNMVDSHS
jgi:DNA-binding CsgD family transcriptional regulator